MCVFTRDEYPVLLENSIGCGVPEPWAMYVKLMLDTMQWYVENVSEFKTLRVIQIKEKFGSLRVYTDFEPELNSKSWYDADYYKGVVNGMIQMASKLCENTCVECGSHEDIVNTTKKDGGWISPRCPLHR